MLHWMRKTDRIIHTLVVESSRKSESESGCSWAWDANSERFISKETKCFENINQWKNKNKNRKLIDVLVVCLLQITVSIRTRLIWPNTIRISKYIQMCCIHIWISKNVQFARIQYNTKRNINKRTHTFSLSCKLKKNIKAKTISFYSNTFDFTLNSLFLAHFISTLSHFNFDWFIRNLWMHKLNSTFMYDFSFVLCLYVW